ncbi:hypothetical protein LSH36_233g02014 [Paralvinella palmiformis]|uniref:G-protein coupled receptors family 1 profile domain-containing protein n=1 Tax=Paralvinella palmiformis TaxID=53620 RepID=A0AAD9JPD5_9ANNE|nr:hypothetical protein LSH36_233g02014 [Paralvinella palmiformis]
MLFNKSWPNATEDDDVIQLGEMSALEELMTSLSGTVLSKVVLYLYPLIGIWTILVNGLTLVVFAKYKQLQRKRNVMIISLSAVDLFTGLTQFLPKLLGRLLGADKSFTVCMVANVMQMAPQWASIAHLVAIAIERHVAITRPLFYDVIMTPRRLAFIVAANIGFSVWISLMLLAWPRDQFSKLCMSILWYPKAYRYVLLVIPMSSAIFLMVLLYFHIYTIARRQERAIAEMDQFNTSGNISNVRKESRATQVFIFICGIALACYIPFCTSMALLIAMPNNTGVIYNYYVSVICLHCNSGMNFLVYAFRNSEFRAKMKELFHCGKDHNVETVY